MTPEEDRILRLYRHTGSQVAKWADDVPLIARAGFRILNGPPVVGGPMVISLNPGLSKAVQNHPGVDYWPKRWPKRPWYPKGVSPFARKLIQIFDVAGLDLGSTNASFVLLCLSNSFKEWKDKVPKNVQRSAEQLSIEVLSVLIETLSPDFIYVAGFKAFELMGCSVDRALHGRRKSGAKFVLLQYGLFSDVPVIASHHPSGAKLSSENMEQIGLALSRM